MNIQDEIFKNDPIYMQSLVGKTVEITTVNKQKHTGIVYVIDPIFKTVVLHKNNNEDEYNTTMILYHSIEDLVVISDEVKENYLIDAQMNDSESCENRKEVVKKWLEKNLIEVKESGEYLKVDDYLVIVPPYEATNCICNSTIILERIQKLLNDIPKDFC